MINVGTKYDESGLYDTIKSDPIKIIPHEFKSVDHENKVKVG